MSFHREDLPSPLVYYVDHEGLKLVGQGKWRTCECVFHGGSDSMRINVETGAGVCMAACGAKFGDIVGYRMLRFGEDFVEAAKALGAWRAGDKTSRSKPLAFSATSALEVLEAESVLVAVAACNVAKGAVLSDDDRQRLVQAAGRIGFISREVRGVRA